MAKKRGLENRRYLGKWSLICGIGSIVAPFLFTLFGILISIIRKLFAIKFLYFEELMLIGFVIGLLVGIVLGIVGIVLYIRSKDKWKSGLITSIVGFVLIWILIIVVMMFIRVKFVGNQPIGPTGYQPPFPPKSFLDGNNKMILSFGSKIMLESKDSTVLGIGVKNVEEEDLKFKIKINFVAMQGKKETINKEMVSGESDEFIGSFIWVDGDLLLKPTEAKAYQIKYLAGNQAGTYLLKIIIEKENGEVYAQKSFFVVIK